jgi:hypothetical protein
MYPWLSHYVKRRWDGFQHSSTCCHARVGSCGQVPLRKAINVSASRDPDASRAYPVLKATDGVTKCLSPSQVGEGGRTRRWVVKSCLPTFIVMRKSEGVDCSRVFLGRWPLLFSQEWWGNIRYGVYGSPALCCWREPLVARILCHNRWPAVPRVLDPNKLLNIWLP